MSPSSKITRATQLTGTSTEMKMTEATVTKVVGAVYCAFATMLSEEGLALMNDTLLCCGRRLGRGETNFKLDSRRHQTLASLTVNEWQPIARIIGRKGLSAH